MMNKIIGFFICKDHYELYLSFWYTCNIYEYTFFEKFKSRQQVQERNGEKLFGCFGVCFSIPIG